MSKGINIHTKERAIKYLVAVIKENNLNPPYENVNIDNGKVREKYFGKDPQRKKYYTARNALLKMGIIKPVDNNRYYLPGVKSFYYNISCNQLTLQAESLHIPIHIHRVYTYNTDIDIDNISLNVYNLKQADRVKFGKGMKIKDMKQSTALAILYKKYPMVRDYAEIADRLNLNYQHLFAQIQFEPKFTRGKKSNDITGIGIRATCPLCYMHSYEKHKNDEEPLPYEDSREQFLTDLVFNDEFEEFDVKGSIPTIARFINKDIIDLDRDPYQDMIDILDKEYDLQVSRDFFKELFMRIYFGGSPKNIRAKLRNKGKDLPLSMIEAMKEVVKQYCGSDDSVNTEAFMHESCIYMDVLYELRINRKLKCAQVYDAFYFRKGQMPEDIKQIIVDCAKEYKYRYRFYINR